jgi:hypothetical protein
MFAYYPVYATAAALSGLGSDAGGTDAPGCATWLHNLVAQPLYEAASRASLDRALAATNLAIIVRLGLGRQQGTEAPVCAPGVHNDGGRGDCASPAWRALLFGSGFYSKAPPCKVTRHLTSQ